MRRLIGQQEDVDSLPRRGNRERPVKLGFQLREFEKHAFQRPQRKSRGADERPEGPPIDPSLGLLRR